MVVVVSIRASPQTTAAARATTTTARRSMTAAQGATGQGLGALAVGVADVAREAAETRGLLALELQSVPPAPLGRQALAAGAGTTEGSKTAHYYCLSVLPISSFFVVR